MQLRICATVAWSCSPNTLSGLFWNWGACGFSVAIVFAASAASHAKCSLRALRLLREAERELHCQESVEPQSPAAQFLAVPQFLGLVPVGNEIDLRFRRGKEDFSVRVQPLKQKSSVQHARHN